MPGCDIHGITAEYSLTGGEIWMILMNNFGLSPVEANGMLALVEHFREVCIPYDSKVLSVSFREGYYSYELREVKQNA